ncbi:ABC transporter permease subunit [Streptomyces indonesiensis]
MFADWTYALQDWPTYLGAAWLSLKLSLAAFVLACSLGLLGALARRSRHALVRAPAAVYVEVIRNTPVLLQMFVAYFALPSAGLRLSPVQAGIAALGVNVGAYLTEIFRARASRPSRAARARPPACWPSAPSGPSCTSCSRRRCATSIRP